MAPLPIDLIKPFLPPGTTPRAQREDSPSGRPRSNRERDPKVVYERDLGDYGWKLLDGVYKDYEAQIKVWKNAFKDVTAAYATAVAMRAKTFTEVEEQYKADAARFAFIFSLVTSGAMTFLGAWVQYKFVPSFTVRKYKWDLASVMQMNEPQTLDRFSKMQAAIFGNLVKDVGKEIGKKFPAPDRRGSYPMDQPSVAANMDADFSRLVDESAEVVLSQLRDVQMWMNQGTEFGAAWLAREKGNVEQARTAVRQHIDTIRMRWAAEWEFFGKTPVKIARHFLADHYERALWADYIHEVFDRAMAAMSKSPRYKRRVEELAKAGLSDLEQLENLEEDWREGFGHHNWIESPIVNRLKELNVVFAETNKGSLDQANRMIDGSPRPEARVKGAVDTGKEIDEIYGWADMFLMGVRDTTAHRFFPESKPRRLDPLPSYR
ncbi:MULTISPECIES: hypothetical protein [unclassified Bradyrhizobium]|uniref:hypothetical protein n=1 Tax=unclassified Bradyrhizobium TaxID=2631580 RepID=UPI0015C79B17|nr:MULTISPECIES: hypothetical protein [unclassified Bradyrhizobium]MBB4256106.1 hypothetical protein [Bradyrhizobium sp. CIR3A]NYG48274.1 hypothetical protein [Bradyrhizobium sp. IAR9]